MENGREREVRVGVLPRLSMTPPLGFVENIVGKFRACYAL